MTGPAIVYYAMESRRRSTDRFVPPLFYATIIARQEQPYLRSNKSNRLACYLMDVFVFVSRKYCHSLNTLFSNTLRLNEQHLGSSSSLFESANNKQSPEPRAKRQVNAKNKFTFQLSPLICPCANTRAPFGTGRDSVIPALSC